MNPPLPVIGQMDWGEQMNGVILDLQARVTALEAVPPPIPAVSTTSVDSITPISGPSSGGTDVTIVGTGFNSFGCFQAALGSVGNWFLLDNFLVVDDNTITGTTVASSDGTGIYQLAVWFNAAESIVLANAFTYA
jgi:hypothetical protein